MIWRQYQNSTNEKPDIHMKLMRKYKEAPTWWYLGLFGIVSLSVFTSSVRVTTASGIQTNNRRCSRSASWLSWHILPT